MKLDILDSPIEPQPKCKGVFYRCRVNPYWSEGQIGHKMTFTKLKKMSCTGCDKCGWIDDDLSEAINNNTFIWPKNPKHMGIYSPKIANISTDWETGYADGWDTTMEEVKG